MANEGYDVGRLVSSVDGYLEREYVRDAVHHGSQLVDAEGAGLRRRAGARADDRAQRAEVVVVDDVVGRLQQVPERSKNAMQKRTRSDDDTKTKTARVQKTGAFQSK